MVVRFIVFLTSATEVRISRSVSESPLEFEITRVDCIYTNMLCIRYLVHVIQIKHSLNRSDPSTAVLCLSDIMLLGQNKSFAGNLDCSLDKLRDRLGVSIGAGESQSVLSSVKLQTKREETRLLKKRQKS